MDHVPPLEQKDGQGRVEEVAVQVVEDEQALLTGVPDFLVDVGLVDPAGHGLAKKER